MGSTIEDIEESRNLAQKALPIREVQRKTLKQIVSELMPDPTVKLDESLRFRIKRAMKEQGKDVPDSSITSTVQDLREEQRNGKKPVISLPASGNKITKIRQSGPSLSDWIRENVSAKPANREERDALIESIRDAGYKNTWGVIYQTLRSVLGEAKPGKKRGPYNKKKFATADQPATEQSAVPGICHCKCPVCALHDDFAKLAVLRQVMEALKS